MRTLITILPPTVVLTTVWCELMADPKLLNFRQRVISRDHKLIAIFALFLGGFVGRAIIDAKGAAATLGVGTGMRVVIAIWWLFVPGKGGKTGDHLWMWAMRADGRERLIDTSLLGRWISKIDTTSTSLKGSEIQLYSLRASGMYDYNTKEFARREHVPPLVRKSAPPPFPTFPARRIRRCLTAAVRARSPPPRLSSSHRTPERPSDDHGPDPKYDGAHRRRIVTVAHFLEALLGEERYKTCAASVPCAYHTPQYATTPLDTAFRDGFIYFNHFIKAQSYELVNQQYLVLAISRGAAIICADGHVGIDIVVPVLIGTVTDLKKEKVTAIFVRAKNGPQYGTRIQRPLFQSMNPYRSGLFDRAVKEPPPVLRMVFALASPEAAVALPAVPARSRRAETRRPR
ncbi:hypothetical protein NUW54_g13129 [Trametes sanguinea]|uniref:Uncharacterized protein n=1 Tax=Trametes sanguinea TaxID=158606 RepID=A0ACC1MPH6_9APHY|nr:hypothetical protein NUW54_g13129 [Trametes sanguinea]